MTDGSDSREVEAAGESHPAGIGGWRRRVWEIVEVARPGDRLSRAFDIAMLALIFLNVLAVVLESVRPLRAAWGPFFIAFEAVSVAVFTVEYVARMSACGVVPRFRGVRGRVRYALTPMAIIDLLAVLPFYLPFVGIDLRFMRSLRLLRILRVAKLGRYFRALNLLGDVVRKRRDELVVTTALLALLLVMAACLMYSFENEAQPDVFSDIPSTMWWSVVTLTTVGYGDIYPVTAAGKICGAAVAILGIAFFAIPTGILGSGFVEEMHRRKEVARCPHCGKEL
ncbi:MAG: ion transporter [Planctomycetaceae bacterium]